MSSPTVATGLIPVYYITCPTCGQTIWQLETMLEQLLANRLLSETGAPFLVFVCSNCSTPFRYDYEQRSAGAMISASAMRKFPTAFSFRAECVDDSCISQVELIAIRDPGTTKEGIRAEITKWKLDGFHCENGHPLLFPDPQKRYLEAVELQIR